MELSQINPDEVPPEVMEYFNKMANPSYLDEQGLFIGRPIITTLFQGNRAVAVGSRLYPRLPLSFTFHDFICQVFKDLLGIEWGQAELAKPREDQHIIVQWLRDMKELQKGENVRVEDAVKDIKSVEASGSAQSFLALAYDAYSVAHCNSIPDELLKRLKIPAQFQGARFELAVAGIFSRAGFKIEWLSNQSNSDKHPEFIAMHERSGLKVIVEAKSRHRPGVLNRSGAPKATEEMAAEVDRLFRDALKKQTGGLPYLIFLDVNLPFSPEAAPLEKKFVEDIKIMLDKYPVGAPKSPEPFSGLFVTNFSWHYSGNDGAAGKAEALSVIPLYPKYPVATLLIQLVHEAINQYGKVPPRFPDQ